MSQTMYAPLFRAQLGRSRLDRIGLRTAYAASAGDAIVIVRVFRAPLRPGAEAEFLAARRAPANKEWEGLISRMVAVRMEGARSIAISISVWRDWETLQAFAGPAPAHPVLPAADIELLDGWTIEHFEVILREELVSVSDRTKEPLKPV